MFVHIKLSQLTHECIHYMRVWRVGSRRASGGSLDSGMVRIAILPLIIITDASSNAGYCNWSYHDVVHLSVTLVHPAIAVGWNVMPFNRTIMSCGPM